VQGALASALVGAIGPAPAWRISPRRSQGKAQPPPNDVITELMAGNERFATNRLTAVSGDLAALRDRTAETQHPKAAVLSCADSRVPVELVFDQSIGDLFVTRVAGNIASPEIIASLEYAVAVLGVRALLVLGHGNCGAVKAAMTAEDVPGQISSLYSSLRPGVERGAGNLPAAIEANARYQADLLRTSSTVIRDAIKKRSINVVSGVYDLATGRVALS
jgi:carbonic anhydrase